MKLYGYFRSSAAYRVRIALNLKGVAVEHAGVHLVKDGGHHRRPDFLAKNPQALVPTLELDDGTILTQSIAIIEYLDTVYPKPRVIPDDPVQAAKTRAVAFAIACDIHPLNNLRVLNYLKGPLKHSQEEADRWYHHWILEGGLNAVEEMIERDPYCFGRQPTLADICLIPQIQGRHFTTEEDRGRRQALRDASRLRRGTSLAAAGRRVTTTQATDRRAESRARFPNARDRLIDAAAARH